MLRSPFKKIHILWFVCIFVRILISLTPLVYKYLLTFKFNSTIVKNLSKINKIIILFMGLGFLYKGIFGSNNETQVRKVFWHNTRLVHALLFILAGVYFDKRLFSSLLLFSSVCFSIIYRFFIGDFK